MPKQSLLTLPRYVTHWLGALLIALSPIAGAEEKLTMNMRDADIRALIQWVADNTGKNIIVHKAVQGKVTVLSTHPVSPEEAYQVFLSVLQVHGFAALESDGTLKVVPANLANQSGIPFSRSAGGDVVVNVIRVENVSATQLAMLLRPLLSKDAMVTPHAETNVIVVADHAQNLNNLKALVKELDQVGDTAIELVRLQHANAEDVLQGLQALMPTTPNPDGTPLSISLGMDERTNSILLSGDPAKRKQFKHLIKQLDTPLVGEGNAQVYYLNYVDAEELVPILQSISQSIETEQKKKDSAISIEASKSANAVVINAPPAMQTSLRRVIEQLDIRRAQVLIESLVVEVSGDVADDIGVTWLSTNVEDANDSAVFGAVNTLGDLEPGAVERAAVPAGGTGPGQIIGVTPGQGFTFGYFEKGNLQAALRLLEQNTKTNVLSTPTIVAIDNEEASLLVGQNVPFKTGQATSGASDTTNPFTTIERQDIGINLVVTPRINQGDSITLDIKQSVESIEPSLDFASDIITNKREIITKALIKDDQILVLGGLIDDREVERKEKVPLLGDIPLLGMLFRSTSKEHRKENLMVFIHPVILKDEEHIRDVTQRRYDFMRKAQEKSKEKITVFNRPGPPEMEEFETFSPIDGQADNAEAKP